MNEAAGQEAAKHPAVQSSDGQPGRQDSGAPGLAGGAEHPEVELAMAFAAGVLVARLLVRLARRDD